MSQVWNYVNSQQYNAACEQGSVFATGVYIQDSCSQTPMDLTDYSVLMQVRPTAESDDLILEISTTNGYATIDAELGKISIYVPSSVTDDLVPGLYVYDLNIIDSSNNSMRIIRGQFEITAEVSR